AVYSNFRNKDGLCLAVLDAIHEEQAEGVNAALSATSTLDELLVALRDWAEQNIGDQAWTALEVEFATRVRHDQQVRNALAARDKAIRANLAELLATHADRLDVTLPLPAADCATAVLSMGIGLGVQRAVDPDIPIRVLPEVIRLLINRE